MKIFAVLTAGLVALAAIIAAIQLASRKQTEMKKQIPIIYTDDYNIRAYGIQKLHPFDTEKYAKVYSHLIDTCGLTAGSFITPLEVTREELLKIHTSEYLESLNQSGTVAQIAELGLLRAIPSSLLQKKLLYPMRLGTGGTIMAVRLAIKHGWAINLSGGYHHAKRDSGGGFCFYADIPLAISQLWEKEKSARILIIDLDAHQGNGLEAVFEDDERVIIVDLYNQDIFPADFPAMKYIDYHVRLESGTDDAGYLPIVQNVLYNAIKNTKPRIIFYNAGTDILAGDPMGNMNISESGIIRRDEIVFSMARKNKIPLVMTLSGGYTKKSGPIIGRSIENLLKKVLKVCPY